MNKSFPAQSAKNNFRRAVRSTGWLALPLLLVACRDENVIAYDIPKESSAPAVAVAVAPAATPAPSPHESLATPAATPNAAMADTPVATASGAGLTWTAPAHWQAKPGSAMRKGSYAIAGEAGATADLSITAFPGDVGGEIANVNRWRGQLQLAPLPDAEAAAALLRINANGLAIAVVTVANPPTRLIGAMVPFGGATWFFKLTGPDALVAKEELSFLEFLKTVKPASAEAAANPTP